MGRHDITRCLTTCMSAPFVPAPVPWLRPTSPMPRPSNPGDSDRPAPRAPAPPATWHPACRLQHPRSRGRCWCGRGAATAATALHCHSRGRGPGQSVPCVLPMSPILHYALLLWSPLCRAHCAKSFPLPRCEELAASAAVDCIQRHTGFPPLLPVQLTTSKTKDDAGPCVHQQPRSETERHGGWGEESSPSSRAAQSAPPTEGWAQSWPAPPWRPVRVTPWA
jgi:hypothetical protein